CPAFDLKPSFEMPQTLPSACADRNFEINRCSLGRSLICHRILVAASAACGYPRREIYNRRIPKDLREGLGSKSAWRRSETARRLPILSLTLASPSPS